MSNSFRNLQKGIQKLKKEASVKEPDRRDDAKKYLIILTDLIHASYLDESTSDYMFIKTLSDVVNEVKYFGGFTKEARERLRVIEKRYNYIHEQKGSDIE